MPRPKPKGQTVHFQLKLYGEDAERWLKVWQAAKNRNPYIDQTRLNRLLLGLDYDPRVIGFALKRASASKSNLTEGI